MQIGDVVNIKGDSVRYTIELLVNGEALLSYNDNGRKRHAEWYHVTELVRTV